MMWGVYVCVGGLEGEAEVKEKLRHVLMTLELFEGITEVHALISFVYIWKCP